LIASTTLASGQPIFTPRYYRKAEAYLRRCQRRVARRTKGSHRRAKAVKLLAKAHQHIRNQRRDFHHQEAHKLVQAYDVIYYEDLRVANMVQNHPRQEQPMRVGRLTILTFKAASAGKRVQAVNPAFTGPRSGCGGSSQGLVCPLGMPARVRRQPHRDHNAALNIVRLGQATLGQATLGQGCRWDTAFRRQREPLGCA
jgi:putative transposase